MTVRRRESLRYYIVKRAILGIVTIFCVILVNFLLIHLAPGNPIIVLAGATATSEEYVEMLEKKYGLDKPVEEQLLIYFIRVLQGDLGKSYMYGVSVTHLIMGRLPYTLVLTLTSLIIASILGIFLGTVSSSKFHSGVDYGSLILSLVGFSMPVFWFAMMLLLVFSLHLGWFPTSGIMSLRYDLQGLPLLVDFLKHLFLPSATLGLFYLALVTRLTRSSMLEILGRDFIIGARAKGLSERYVLYRHALRNAILPVITLIGVSMSELLAGAILTETVFGWPGLGRLLYNSVLSLDYPVIMGVFILTSTITVFSSLFIDILYAYLDPRIRYR